MPKSPPQSRFAVFPSFRRIRATTGIGRGRASLHKLVGGAARSQMCVCGGSVAPSSDCITDCVGGRFMEHPRATGSQNRSSRPISQIAHLNWGIETAHGPPPLERHDGAKRTDGVASLCRNQQLCEYDGSPPASRIGAQRSVAHSSRTDNRARRAR